MLVIGLTGNFGTGKTTVSKMLAKLGAAIIDADKLGHEAALLIEADGLKHLVDQVWVTIAPEATIVRRLKRGRGLKEEQVLARLQAQMSPGEKVKRADVVIDTDCSLKALRTRVTELWHTLL